MFGQPIRPSSRPRAAHGPLAALVAVALTAVGAAALVGGCGPADTAGTTPTLPSGIRGTVLLGPTCPLGQEPGANDPVPCLTPYAAQLAVIDGEGSVVARVTSAADGRFEVSVAPGEYTVAPQNGDPYPTAQSVPVVVSAGEFAEIQINYDTGIR